MFGWVLLVACGGGGEDTGEVTEPLDLPEDLAEAGVPVGVRTVTYEDVTMEVWYPAPDSAAGEDTDLADISEFIPDSVIDLIGEVSLPLLDMGAVRDAPVREAGEPYPVVFFSHGTAAFRTQSLDYAAHLASRGYVVVAPDHPGRMMSDFLPCLFVPALEGCNLSGMASDPGPEDLLTALDWIEGAAADFEADPSRLGLSGHSAGGWSAATLGSEDDRFTALLPMAYDAEITRDVPTLFLDGSCDGIVLTEEIEAAAAAASDGTVVDVLGAGHMAFTDICAMELDQMAHDLFEGRDDINEGFLEMLVMLATDGCPGNAPTVERDECPGDYLDLDTSSEVIRYYSTAFFDEQLRGAGDGVTAGVFADAEVK